MIYTVTLNPSLDYILTTDALTIGRTNRSKEAHMLAGGKGINVSAVLHNLGASTTAVYYEAGFVGQELTRRIAACGITAKGIPLANGCTRINVKLRGIEETEINATGPTVSEEELHCLSEYLQTLTSSDILVLAGSIPAGVPDTIYREWMEMLAAKKVQVVVDTTGARLLETLPLHPFLIKPNGQELEELFGVSLVGEEAVLRYGKELQNKGARNVLVSLGGDGAILFAESGEIYRGTAPEGIVVNAVGAGDSMVAGFLAGYTAKKAYAEILGIALAAGSASAFSEGLATKEEVEELVGKAKVERIR